MNDAEKLVDQNAIQAMLKEYELLRQELMNINGIRFNVLGFTIVAVGTVLGLLGERASDSTALNTPEIDYFVLVLSTFALGLLITAQILTIYSSQKIRNYGAYIRIYIEPKLDGLAWETRLFHQRTLHKNNLMPPATSQSLGFYYAFLSIAVTLISYGVNPNYSWKENILMVGFLLINLIFSVDLLTHFTSGWRSEWPSDPNDTV